MNRQEIEALAKRLNSPEGAGAFDPETAAPPAPTPAEVKPGPTPVSVAPAAPQKPSKPLTQGEIEKLIFLRLLQRQQEEENE